MVFPIAVAEGPIISVLSGFLVWGGVFNLYIVFFVLLFGDLVGDSIYYLIGRYGGRRLIHKVMGSNENRLENLEKRFHRQDWKILLLGKTQAIGSVILIASGIVNMSYSRFIIYNIMGSVPKIIIFMLIGYYFGKAYLTINTYMGYFALVWLILALGILAMFLYIRKYIKEKNFNNI